MKKRVLSLLLAAVMVTALLPMSALAANGSVANLDLGPKRFPQNSTGAYVDIPVRLKGTDGQVDRVNALRAAYVAAQSETTCDGEPITLYTVYPKSRFETTYGSPNLTLTSYHATVVGGSLHQGERSSQFVPEDPHRTTYWYAEEEDVGDYYIVEFDDDLFTARFAVHIIKGTKPASAPTEFASYYGFSQEITDYGPQLAQELNLDYPENVDCYAVPAGTVVTLPTTAMGEKCFPASARDQVDLDPEGSETMQNVEVYLCNERECFTVEPGMVYQLQFDIYYRWSAQTDEGEEFYWQETEWMPNTIYVVADDNAPAVSNAPAPQTATAYASTQTVQVDGKSVTFNAYALKDANGNDTNYIKLRDVADVLSGSAAQFQVGWDGSIAITTGQMYTPNGTENIQNFTGDQTYTISTSPVTINGVTANLEAITLTDASGGGYTYFKLRDLGEALGFDVSWSAETGITIDPSSPYNANS